MTTDDLRVIKDGIGADDRIIVNGLMRARPGAKGARRRSRAPERRARRGAAGPPQTAEIAAGRKPMRISHFFIDRPIFASVVSIVFVILGGVAFFRLPIAQYPEIAPPTITVSGQYPGASADVVAATVVTPIEQQINGVENMIYLSSNSTGDGRFTISVTFDIGTNLDIAQVQVQNRVAIAQPRLPADVRNIGVTVNKSSPDLMMVVHLYSPDKSRDTLFISNYATHRNHRCAHARRWRRLDHRVRQPRLCDAGLARSRPAAIARADRGRRGARRCRARTCRWLPACSTSRRSTSRAHSRFRCRRSAASPIRTSSAIS